MTNEAAELFDSLQGKAWEIATTVRREVDAVAPYAELGFALGVPTWFHGERVVSMVPYLNKCTLHFWDGEALESFAPGRLRSPSSGPIRTLELRSMLDVDEPVKTLLREAFALRVAAYAKSGDDRDRNAALS